MKKSIFKISLSLILFGFLSISCDKGNQEPQTPEAPSIPGTITADIKYEMPDRHDLIKYVDITAYYTGKDGKEVSEVITTSTWSKSLTGVPVPGTYKLKLVYVRNNTPLEDKEVFTFGSGLKFSYLIGTDYKEDVSSSSLSVGKSKVEDYIQTLINRGAEISQEITK